MAEVLRHFSIEIVVEDLPADPAVEDEGDVDRRAVGGLAARLRRGEGEEDMAPAPRAGADEVAVGSGGEGGHRRQCRGRLRQVQCPDASALIPQ